MCPTEFVDVSPQSQSLGSMDVKQAWRRRKERLQTRFTWLRAMNEDSAEPLRLGCVLCLQLFGAEASARSHTLAAFPVATKESLRIPKLLRHQQLQVHRKAVPRACCTSEGGTSTPFMGSEAWHVHRRLGSVATRKAWREVPEQNTKDHLLFGGGCAPHSINSV